MVLQRRTEPTRSQKNGKNVRYSTDYGNPETDFSLGELTPKHFSFNSHLGACPACHGLGHAAGLRCRSDDFRSAENARGRRDHAVAARDETDAGLLPPAAKRARETFRGR